MKRIKWTVVVGFQTIYITSALLSIIIHLYFIDYKYIQNKAMTIFYS